MNLVWLDFVRDHARCARGDFLARIRDPHLLLPPLGEPDDAASFRTVKLRGGAIGGAARGAVETLAPVRKRADSNVFALMVTVGRASNNDVVVPDGRVSKFHCYLRRVASTWTISDASSMNGTWVDGRPLPAQGSLPLGPSARVRLGDGLELEFLEPEALYERVLAASALVG